MLNKTVRLILALVIGIIIGIGGTIWVTNKQNSSSKDEYVVVTGPTHADEPQYVTGHSKYTFPNPERKLCVIVKHGNTYALYFLNEGK